MSKKIIVIVVTLIIVLNLAGCGESTGFLGGTKEQGTKTVESKEVYIPIEKMRTLNPIISKDEDAYYLDRLIYEGLFAFDKNLSLTKVLADNYTYSDNGYSVTIKLKSGIVWQDGKSLTAEDVKFTIDAIKNASYSNSTLYAANIANISYTTVDRKDPLRITVNFLKNDNVSMTNFTFPIVAKHQFKDTYTAKQIDSKFLPIGTGPYKVSSYNELTNIILIGNSKYHGASTPTNKLNFQIIPEKRDAVNLMDVNNISITFSKEIDRDTVYTNKDVDVLSFPSNEAELIGFNFNNAVLTNPKIRKAIACAIDTGKIIESAYFKNGVQNDTIYYPNFLGVTSSNSGITYNIVEAKKLMMEAGYIDRNSDGVVENPSNQSLSLNILINSEDQSRVAAAQIIKEGFDQLAIQTNIISKDWNGYNTELAAGNYDIYLGGYKIKENYDLRFLLHTNFHNLIGYSNPELDVLLDKMESGLTQKERVNTFLQIRKILTAELPYFCVLYKTYGATSSPSLKGVEKPTFENIYQGCENWYSLIEVGL